MINFKSKTTKQYLLAIIIVVGVFVIDMITKSVTDGVKDMYVIDNFLVIHSIYNYAAAFSSSWGMSSEVFLVVVTIFCIAMICAMIFFLVWIKNKNLLFVISVSLMITGGLGNLVDRLAFGYVRDFIKIEYFGFELFGSYSFPVFNVADMAVVVGSVLVVIWLIVFYMRDNPDDKKKLVDNIETVSEDESHINDMKENADVAEIESTKDKS